MIIQNPMNFLLLVFVSGTIVAQLHFLNLGLKFYRSLEVIPIYQCTVILGNLICGGIVFKEFLNYTTWELESIFIGTLICLSGIMIILEKHNYTNQFKVEIIEKNK